MEQPEADLSSSREAFWDASSQVTGAAIKQQIISFQWL